jgi:hypothetical protein
VIHQQRHNSSRRSTAAASKSAVGIGAVSGGRSLRAQDDAGGHHCGGAVLQRGCSAAAACRAPGGRSVRTVARKTTPAAIIAEMRLCSCRCVAARLHGCRGAAAWLSRRCCSARLLGCRGASGHRRGSPGGRSLRAVARRR